MDLLAKIIFVADKIEENRNYENEEKQKSLEYARQLAKEDINKAVLLEIDESLVYTIKKEELIHTDSVLARNKLLEIVR